MLFVKIFFNFRIRGIVDCLHSTRDTFVREMAMLESELPSFSPQPLQIGLGIVPSVIGKTRVVSNEGVQITQRNFVSFKKICFIIFTLYVPLFLCLHPGGLVLTNGLLAGNVVQVLTQGVGLLLQTLQKKGLLALTVSVWVVGTAGLWDAITTIFLRAMGKYELDKELCYKKLCSLGVRSAADVPKVQAVLQTRVTDYITNLIHSRKTCKPLIPVHQRKEIREKVVKTLEDMRWLALLQPFAQYLFEKQATI